MAFHFNPHTVDTDLYSVSLSLRSIHTFRAVLCMAWCWKNEHFVRDPLFPDVKRRYCGECSTTTSNRKSDEAHYHRIKVDKM